jgi:glucokinase
VALGVDIGGSKVLGIALDAGNQVVAESRVPTPTALKPGHLAGEAVANAIADVVAQLETSLGVTGPIPSVGVGAPGMLDREGRLRFSPNLPQGHGVDWKVLIDGRIPGRAVVIENDANLAALAEHRLGAARGYHHVVVVTLGTGIGGGLIIDGEVQVGGHGFAGEIGHMVVDPAGPPCPCGRRGCWERYASGGGLGLLAREAALAGKLPRVVTLSGGDPESVRGEHVTAAALAGDPGARRVVEEVGWWVGFGLANLACVVDPECFVLAGGLVGAGDLLLGAARRAYAGLVAGGATRPETAIVAAADQAFAVAHQALEAGVDGVFCYDHLWPIAQPDRPALAPFPILATLAAANSGTASDSGGPFFGTLVARIGLVPNGVLLAQFTTLARFAPGRVIAGLGTGDRLSEAENRAYGIPFATAAERRADMVELARALRAEGLTVWLAGGSAARIEEAQAARVALTVWNAEPSVVADRTQAPHAVEVTWGGPPPENESILRATVHDLARAGATWVIFASPTDPVALVAAARAAGRPAQSTERGSSASSGEVETRS